MFVFVCLTLDSRIIGFFHYRPRCAGFIGYVNNGILNLHDANQASVSPIEPDGLVTTTTTTTTTN